MSGNSTVTSWLRETFDGVFPWRLTLAPDSRPGWSRYATVYCQKRWNPATRGEAKETGGVLAFEDEEEAQRIATVFGGKCESIHFADDPTALYLSPTGSRQLSFSPEGGPGQSQKKVPVAEVPVVGVRNYSRQVCNEKWNLDTRAFIADRLRRAGWNFDEIAAECQFANRGSASEAVKDYRRRLYESGVRLEADYRFRHLDILDELATRLGEKIEKNDYDSRDVYALLAVLEREAKLTGIETLRIEHSVVDPAEMTQAQLYERMERIRQEKAKLLASSITVVPNETR